MLLLFGCGEAGSDESRSFGSPPVGGSVDVGDNAGTGGSTGSEEPLPEREIEASFRAPLVTGRLIWSSNPESGKVALIDSKTLSIRILQAGLSPTELAAVPSNQAGEQAAIVLNQLSQDATLFRVAEGGAVSQVTFDTHPGANAWAISPSGRWAIAWSDYRELASVPDPTEGFHELTVIDLSLQFSPVRLSVGFRPTQIVFDSQETRAYALTEPGISVISLDEQTSQDPGQDAPGPHSSALIEVSDDPLEEPAARDVTFTKDARYALVRVDGQAEVRIVDLESGTRSELQTSSAVSDLDLSADGTFAVGVLRETSSLISFPVPEIITEPNLLHEEAVDATFGSVVLSPNADFGLLFSTGLPSDSLSIFGFSEPSLRSVRLKSPILAVLLAQDGKHAITVQGRHPDGHKAGAFGIVPTEVQLSPKIVATDAPVSAVAFGPSKASEPTEIALVTTRDDASGTYAAYLTRLTSLRVDRFELATPPLSLGIIAQTQKAFVAQEHPEGRITFFDLESGTTRTLTGFELSSKVVE